jgi:hypothetical protein
MVQPQDPDDFWQLMRMKNGFVSHSPFAFQPQQSRNLSGHPASPILSAGVGFGSASLGTPTAPPLSTQSAATVTAHVDLSDAVQEQVPQDFAQFAGMYALFASHSPMAAQKQQLASTSSHGAEMTTGCSGVSGTTGGGGGAIGGCGAGRGATGCTGSITCGAGAPAVP